MSSFRYGPSGQLQAKEDQNDSNDNRSWGQKRQVAKQARSSATGVTLSTPLTQQQLALFQQQIYTVYGTAMPLGDQENGLDKDSHRFVPVWQQVATDDRGRRRFHGAFTGGFSAGYFNTVGSKEGWMPSTFTSSRQAKNQQDSSLSQRQAANFQDFMDDEDLREYRKRHIQTTDTFDALHKTAKTLANQQESGILAGNAILDNLLIPVQKETSFGMKLMKFLGWQPGMDRGPVEKLLLEQKQIEESKKKTREMIQLALVEKKIGIHQDEDFENIYDDDKEKQDLYDRVLGDEPIVAVVQPKQQPQKMTKPRANLQTRRCHDQKWPLEGFVLFDEDLQKLFISFPGPQVPDEFKVPETPSLQGPILPAIQSQRFTAQQRGTLLGESSSQDLKSQLYQQSQGLDPQRHFLDENVAQLALKGFIPFQGAKQERYKAFLSFYAGFVSSLPDWPLDWTEQEKELERDEFVKAAKLFRPLSHSMSARFQRESSLNVVLESKEKPESTSQLENHKERKSSRQIYAWIPSALLCKRFSVQQPSNDPNDPMAFSKSTAATPLLSREKMQQLLQEHFHEQKQQKQSQQDTQLFEPTFTEQVSVGPSEDVDEEQVKAMTQTILSRQKSNRQLLAIIFNVEPIDPAKQEEDDEAAVLAFTQRHQQQTMSTVEKVIVPIQQKTLEEKMIPNVPMKPIFVKKQDRKKQQFATSTPLPKLTKEGNVTQSSNTSKLQSTTIQVIENPVESEKKRARAADLW